nr:MAG TPA: hypothetical protein [Caudoviricetes sp.]
MRHINMTNISLALFKMPRYTTNIPRQNSHQNS